MNDSHTTVVTKYFAKITILFLQCIKTKLLLLFLQCKTKLLLHDSIVYASTQGSTLYTDHALEYTENSVACSIIHGVMSLVSILEGRCSCSLYQDSPSCESDAQLWWRLCQCCCSTRSSNCSGSDQCRPTSASRLHPALFSQWLSGVLHNAIVVHVS